MQEMPVTEPAFHTKWMLRLVAGSHEMSMTVKGTGLIANIIRSIVGGFNVKKKVRNAQSNRGKHTCNIAENMTLENTVATIQHLASQMSVVFIMTVQNIDRIWF